MSHQLVKMSDKYLCQKCCSSYTSDNRL